MNRHYLFVYILVGVFMQGCSDNAPDTITEQPHQTEEQMLLNGNWKFNTFLGDGSNYREVKPTSNDIIVDNSDNKLVEINGPWKTSNVASNETRLWGDNYLVRTYKTLDDSVNVKFHYPEFESGYYEHFVYYPYGVSLHSQYSIKHSEGISERYIGQRNRPSQWISLGIFKLTPEIKPYIEVNTLSPGQKVVADAVMIRPVSETSFLKEEVRKKEAYSTTISDEAWHDLKVPGHWGMINKFSTYTGKGWYRKSFNTPETWSNDSGKTVRLAFDGVYHIANVYLNGKFLGKHQGGFTPFEFDVTDKLNYSGDNLIAVEADNSAIVGATWNWGGIIRDVKLINSDNARIDYQYIHAEPDLVEGNASLSLKVRIKNNGANERKLDFKASVIRGEILANFAHQIEIPANTIIEFELDGVLTKNQVELWHFDHPNLYQLNSEISENGNVVHSKSDRFGIRKIEITDTAMLLNGEPVRIGGYNRISDHRYWGSSEPLELLEQDIDLMKNAGANFMRIMHGTQNKKLIELCDEKGILIFEEANIRELTNPEFVAPEYTINKQWLREMVERDANHPSIIGWSVGNELKDHYDYVDKMIEFVKTELDPHRLVTNVSNTGYRKTETTDVDPLGLSDLMMQNIYQKDPEKVITTIGERWPNKPLFISEYGLGRFNSPSLDQDYTNFSEWHAMIRGRNTHVIGTSLWSFNDYRSGYAQTLEEGNRAWGIVTNWREKRRGYKTFQQELSPIKSLSFIDFEPLKGSSTIKMHIRDADDYPSYTMRDYSLVWKLRDIDGQIIEENHSMLPTLTPQSGLWSSDISWNNKQLKVHDLTVQVKSTNGYIRSEIKHVFGVPNLPSIKGVISAANSVRVLFDNIYSGDEYYLRYTNNDGQMISTSKTIDNHIDLVGLKLGESYQVELIASNKLGDSNPTEVFIAKTTGGTLPPVIWKSMIRDNKLIVGFSGDVDDESYEVRYGYSQNELDLTEFTVSRGMLTANIDEQADQVFYQLRRFNKNSNSQWSLLNIVKKNGDIGNE